MVVADLKEDQSLLLPPIKRGRYDQLEWSSNRYIMTNDRNSLIDATRQMILMERPDLIDLFMTFCKCWQAPPSKWPSTPLTPVQHRMANEGLISMDGETCRWNVKLTQLISVPNDCGSVSLTANALTGRQQSGNHAMELSAVQSGEECSSIANNSTAWMSKLGMLIETNSQSSILRETGWQGVLARVDKKKTPVKLLSYAGDILSYISSLNNVLSISLRSPHDEMLKKEFVAFGFLQNTAAETASAFQQYISYFEERNRAGVIRISESENTMLYVIPLSVNGISDVINHYHIELPSQLSLLLIVAQASSSE